MPLGTTIQDSQSEKGVRKQNDPADAQISQRAETTVSKYTVDYWRDKLFRPTYQRGKESHEVQQWYVQIQFGGRREKVGLGSNSKEDCARAAAKFFKRLQAKGWDAARTELSPDRKTKPRILLTVGDLIERLRPISGARQRTFEEYAYSFRKIVREVTHQRDTTKSRFNPKSKEWRRESDAILLARLKPDSVDEWKLKVISAAGNNPVAQGRARRNVNSFIRNARALFSRKRLKRLKERGVILPEVLPFQGVELERQGSSKYHSTFDARTLIRKAKAELAERERDAYKVILLGLGAGLRRKEIDGLRRTQLYADKILVESHDEFEAKTDDSEDVVYVDSGLMIELKQLLVEGATEYVIEPDKPFQSGGRSQYYRAQLTFEKVNTWLRANGVTGTKPLHTLRKEFGSIICAVADIHTASRQLRHKQISTTAAHYTDHRRRDSVPIGNFLAEAAPAGK